MPRPLIKFALPLTAAAALAISACSPENLARAGDVRDGLGIVPVADSSLPAPAVQQLAPICAAPDQTMITLMQDGINAERERLGRSPLKFKPKLDEAAQAHACDMVSVGKLTVAGSNGSSVVDRVRAVRYGACSTAQLIGRAGDSATQLSRWIGYTPDEEILTHQKFDDAGLGLVQSGGTYWWSLVMADTCR